MRSFSLKRNLRELSMAFIQADIVEQYEQAYWDLGYFCNYMIKPGFPLRNLIETYEDPDL
jgi:hypothetical protein